MFVFMKCYVEHRKYPFFCWTNCLQINPRHCELTCHIHALLLNTYFIVIDATLYLNRWIKGAHLFPKPGHRQEAVKPLSYTFKCHIHFIVIYSRKKIENEQGPKDESAICSRQLIMSNNNHILLISIMHYVQYNTILDITWQSREKHTSRVVLSLLLCLTTAWKYLVIQLSCRYRGEVMIIGPLPWYADRRYTGGWCLLLLLLSLFISPHLSLSLLVISLSLYPMQLL